MTNYQTSPSLRYSFLLLCYINPVRCWLTQPLYSSDLSSVSDTSSLYCYDYHLGYTTIMATLQPSWLHYHHGYGYNTLLLQWISLHPCHAPLGWCAGCAMFPCSNEVICFGDGTRCCIAVRGNRHSFSLSFTHCLSMFPLHPFSNPHNTLNHPTVLLPPRLILSTPSFFPFTPMTGLGSAD